MPYADPEREKAYQREYTRLRRKKRVETPEARRLRHQKERASPTYKEWRRLYHQRWLLIEGNKEKYDAQRIEWRRQHPEVSRRYLQNDRGRTNERAARIRAERYKRTPEWLTEKHIAEMKAIYREARARSISSGIKHHVDHIFPLRGENSCGLHVPWNMQIITADENFRKNRRMPVGVHPLARATIEEGVEMALE